MFNTIYLDYNGRVIKLPVNPEEIWVKIGGNNESVDMVQNGEVNIPKDKKLTTIELAGFFPEDTDAPYVQRGADGADAYVDFFKTLQDAKKPFRFIISGTDVNQEMLIESFEYGFSGGCGDIEFSLSMKEYRPITYREVKLVKINETPIQKAAMNRTEPAKKTVTIGCSVNVNGQLHRDSYGGGPGKTLSNYKGVVNFINQAGSKSYHVTDQNGGWLGWVSAESVEVL